jgi:hypothetical protein
VCGVNIYLIFKYIHVLAVIFWVGGVVTLAIFNARMEGERNGAVLAAVGRQSGLYGQRVLGPASGIALLAGLVTMFAGRIPFTSFWILWGLGAFVVSMVLGGTLIQRTGQRLGELGPTADPGSPEVAALRRRLVNLNWINIVLLLVTVGVMIFKPTL